MVRRALQKRHERRMEQIRAYKRSLAPSIEFRDSILDQFSIEGVMTLESIYRDQVGRTGVRVRYSSPTHLSGE